MDPIKQTFECWAIVELFGHAKIAGKCTEQNIAGQNMLRVDVPGVTTDLEPAILIQQPFTKFYGATAIYSITPVDELTARYFASKLTIAPIQHWDINEIMKKQANQHLLNEVKEEISEEFEPEVEPEAKPVALDNPAPPRPYDPIDDLPF